MKIKHKSETRRNETKPNDVDKVPAIMFLIHSVVKNRIYLLKNLIILKPGHPYCSTDFGGDGIVSIKVIE